MSFLAPFAGLAALFAIPIILLYILRLRRRETVVSSNFLWQQILRDREANTPWQRLRRNILLILQLLILAFLVLALMRPAQVVPTITASKTVILLDASASMNATDVNGDTRFEVAQREANLLLNDLTVDDEVSIIRVAQSAEPMVAYTNNLLEARSAIFDADPGQGRGDWSTALTLAAAGAQGADNFSIIIISDGGIDDAGQLPENIPAPVIVPIGESSANLALTALATRTLPGQNPQLFVQIENYADIENEVSLVIRLDGDLWESESPTISAESSRSFVFEVNQSFTTVQAELVLDNAVVDHLASDNVAYTVAGENATRRVLLVSGQRNRFLEEVLRSLPNVQVFTGDPTTETLPATLYDLYVFNGYLPDALPEADMLIVNPPESSEIFTLGGENTATNNIGVATSDHPLSAFLTVDSVNLRAFRTISDVEWATPIVSTDGGDVIVAGDNRGRQVAIMNFNLLDSDLPLQIAFPIFMTNMIEWSTPANIISGGTAFSIGDVVRINPTLDAEGVEIILPDGTARDLTLTGDTLAFSETTQTGFYVVNITTDGEVSSSEAFAVNLFADESDITPIEGEILSLGGGALDDDAEEQLGFREWWRPLLMLAIVVLLYEWVVYFRRLRVPDDVEVDIRRTTARS